MISCPHSAGPQSAGLHESQETECSVGYTLLENRHFEGFVDFEKNVFKP